MYCTKCNRSIPLHLWESHNEIAHSDDELIYRIGGIIGSFIVGLIFWFLVLKVAGVL